MPTAIAARFWWRTCMPFNLFSTYVALHSLALPQKFAPASVGTCNRCEKYTRKSMQQYLENVPKNKRRYIDTLAQSRYCENEFVGLSTGERPKSSLPTCSTQPSAALPASALLI